METADERSPDPARRARRIGMRRLGASRGALGHALEPSRSTPHPRPLARTASLAARRRGIRGAHRDQERSPSARSDRSCDADAGKTAERYRDAGSGGISLVTEEDYLPRPAARASAGPRGRIAGPDGRLRRRDRHQIAWARSPGADAILLIAALYRIERAAALAPRRRANWGWTSLVETHDRGGSARSRTNWETELVGVNNRDLSTFVVDLATSERLFARLPKARARLAESGIRYERRRRERRIRRGPVATSDARPGSGSRLARTARSGSERRRSDGGD